MIHLAHRDEKVPEMAQHYGITFDAHPACGQTRGFNHEAEDATCVGPTWESKIECRRCLRIYRHWKRVAENKL